MTTILLVRHGQTEWNRIERFRGQIDVKLNENGFDQAIKTAYWIRKHWKPAAIYSSPLKRAIQTAGAIAEAVNLQVEPELSLIDIDYGDWGGLTPEEVKCCWPGEHENWYHHPEQARIPNGENLIQVQTRAMEKLTLLLEANPARTLVLVSHTVVNRLILLGILGLGFDHFWQLRQEPCAINVIEVNNNEYSLVAINNTCHLEL